MTKEDERKHGSRQEKEEPKKHEMSIEEAIVEALTKNSFLRKPDLIEHVKRRTNYETAAIENKISDLKGKLILKMNSIELQKYGIDEPDGRAAYFTLKQTPEIKDHVEKILGLLRSQKQSDIGSVISELDMYGSQCVLDQAQLSFVIDNLPNTSTATAYGMMRIIFTHIYSYGVYPHKKLFFLKKMGGLLKNVKIESDKNLHVILIWTLGLYENNAVVEILKDDLKHFDLKNRGNYELAYMQPFTSRVIEDNRDDLFDFQRELEQHGKRETATLLMQIRSKAAEDVRVKRTVEGTKLPDQVHIVYKKVKG